MLAPLTPPHPATRLYCPCGWRGTVAEAHIVVDDLIRCPDCLLLALVDRVDDETPPIRFAYRNYRGEVTIRRVRAYRPMPRVRYGQTEHHPELQPLMDAWDLDRQALRTFALRDVLEWLGEPPSRPPDAGAPCED